MYIQTKKAIVLMIFLLSIILVLSYKLHLTQSNVLNCLLISDKANITDDSGIKLIWQQMEALKSEPTIFQEYTDVSNNYLQINDENKFNTLINDAVQDKDVIVIVGEKYNKYLLKAAEDNPRVKFILIENSQTLQAENLYKININWEEIFQKVKSDMESELEKSDSKVKTNLVYIYTDSEYQQKLIGMLRNVFADSKTIQLVFLESNENKLATDLDTSFEYGNTYYFSTDLLLQRQIVDKLVQLQRENIDLVNESQVIEENNSSSDSSSSETESNSTDSKTKSSDSEDLKADNVEFKKIKYYGNDPGYEETGNYDNTLNTVVSKENIFKFEFEFDFKKDLMKVILEEKPSSNYNLNSKDESIKINNIE